MYNWLSTIGLVDYQRRFCVLNINTVGDLVIRLDLVLETYMKKGFHMRNEGVKFAFQHTDFTPQFYLF